MSSKKRIALLGATGSIGTQAIDVVLQHADKLQIVALSAHSRSAELLDLAQQVGADICVLTRPELDERGLSQEFAACGIDLAFGASAICELIQSLDVDIVLNAMTGAAGLEASYETLRSGKVLALANKESLVVAGDLLMPMAKPGQLLPIDSEHGAIFQCLMGEEASEVERLWITASGGPFRGKKTADLQHITSADALAHPTWNMGPKISIDSSTLMNKGLEVIEAHHLFSMPYDRISVVVQPQSIIHSMVEYCDGSVKAHLGTTDMRIPIQYALSYPERWSAPVEPMNFWDIAKIEFSQPDIETFPCLRLAYEAGKAGGSLPCVMNAANEVAVEAFLQDKIAYLDIARSIEQTLEVHRVEPVECLEQLVDLDQKARVYTRRLISHTL